MEKININKRLKTISAYLLDSKKMLDIGCDHALLGVYACLNNQNINVIASDIREKPLIKARENIIKYHLEKRIKIKKADGLEAMEENVDTVVISGMGTLNILKILENINNYPSVSNIVLSPNNDFVLLRAKVQELGFQIIKEEIVKDNNKYYLIILFNKGKEKTDNFFGKLDLSNTINIDYFRYLYFKNKQIINQINNDYHKKELLIKQNDMIRKKVDLK